jgi:hypothetical protein
MNRIILHADYGQFVSYNQAIASMFCFALYETSRGELVNPASPEVRAGAGELFKDLLYLTRLFR